MDGVLIKSSQLFDDELSLSDLKVGVVWVWSSRYRNVIRVGVLQQCVQ